MDRGVAQETAALTDRIRQAEADFDAEWPSVEGQDDPDRKRMRVEAAHRALFDPSREATLARKYEAASERCFFRSLKELRLVEEQAKASGSNPEVGSPPASLGSFFPEEARPSSPDPMTAGTPRKASVTAPKGVEPASSSRPMPVPTFPVTPEMPVGGGDLPFSIGRAG
jgi:hypothetical protein